ncbi:hypothetical protein HIM_00920 [Hirsutella minnesotensis 3608]|nr:hypothetical protein HIM_00920 [Hirsutella minnesotensis 3608]
MASQDEHDVKSSTDSDSDLSEIIALLKNMDKKKSKASRDAEKRARVQKMGAKQETPKSCKLRKEESSDSGSETSDSACEETGFKGKRDSEIRPDAEKDHLVDLFQQLEQRLGQKLEQRISTLGKQIAQGPVFAQQAAAGSIVYGMAPNLANAVTLPIGSYLPAAAQVGGPTTQPTQPPPIVTPPSGRTVTIDRVSRSGRGLRRGSSPPLLDDGDDDVNLRKGKTYVSDKKASRSGTRADFKRVDWVWDSSLYTYKLQDTAEMSTSSLDDDYIFHVRRTFDCEGKYRATFVDIKSKLLRECLQDVIGSVRGASLVDETPKLDPNLLFLLSLASQAPEKGEAGWRRQKERGKNSTRLQTKRKQLKVLIKYLDEDYAKVKESLYPMIESGVITFDLLWALWKPNTLIYGTTYGSIEDPRVFKVDMAYRQSSIMRGEFYFIEGKYLEFDGKKFGYGTVAEEIPEFQGARKITTLPCYPLKYHKEQDQIRQTLISRGKKFVALNGVHYKCYSGIAYMKRKKGSILKFNVQQSRVMVDPAIFRRINPNYCVSMVRPKDHDVLSDDGPSVDESGCCEYDSDDGSEQHDKIEYVSKVFKNDKGDVFVAKIPRREKDGSSERALQALPKKADLPVDKSSTQSSMNGVDAAVTPSETSQEPLPEFSEEDYLIASPIVFGFSFSEKQWLELSVSAVKDITWNETAWDSLVLDSSTKDLIKALVQSRKYHATQTIDDVIQGKGKGLVTVLHGPPGTGKTLTAEGISELLKCPLYMASAGELGTDPRYLEAELQKILDICHAWGAILLLDEADVFLEKRNMQDIHRNALVSIFLRQLEYFQGILFLTTNRVETFDEAFQSRIHIALRYDTLDVKAKKTIFQMFFDRIKTLGKLELEAFSEEDLDKLARHDLNGREIKNVVGSAQDLAVNKGEAFSMRHIRQVLDVHAKFGRDLRGGTGYEEAMRSYF